MEKQLLPYDPDGSQILRLAEFENQLSVNILRGWPLTAADLFEAEFGDRGTAYWSVILLDPMTPRLLARCLSRHLTEGVPHVAQPLLEEGVLHALREGIDGGRIACVTPITRSALKEPTRAGAEADFNRRNRERYGPHQPCAWADTLRITDPVAAIKWMMAAPRWQHLVPGSVSHHPAFSVERNEKPLQEELDLALLAFAKEKGRKLKQSDPEAGALLFNMGAKTRQIPIAFRNLPSQYRHVRGRPNQHRA